MVKDVESGKTELHILPIPDRKVLQQSEVGVEICGSVNVREIEYAVFRRDRRQRETSAIGMLLWLQAARRITGQPGLKAYLWRSQIGGIVDGISRYNALQLEVETIDRLQVRARLKRCDAGYHPAICNQVERLVLGKIMITEVKPIHDIYNLRTI